MTYARLALAVGQPSLRKLLRSVTAKDLTFWLAYEIVEGPIGGRQDRQRWAYTDVELTGDEEPEERDELLGEKLMRMFKHPDMKK